MTDKTFHAHGELETLLEGLRAELQRRQDRLADRVRTLSGRSSPEDDAGRAHHLRCLVELVEALIAENSECLAAEILGRSLPCDLSIERPDPKDVLLVGHASYLAGRLLHRHALFARAIDAAAPLKEDETLGTRALCLLGKSVAWCLLTDAPCAGSESEASRIDPTQLLEELWSAVEMAADEARLADLSMLEDAWAELSDALRAPGVMAHRSQPRHVMVRPDLDSDPLRKALAECREGLQALLKANHRSFGAVLKAVNPFSQAIEPVAVMVDKPIVPINLLDFARAESRRTFAGAGELGLANIDPRVLVVTDYAGSLNTDDVVIDHLLGAVAGAYFPLDETGGLPTSARDLRFVLWVFSDSAEVFEAAAGGDVSRLEEDLERAFYREAWGPSLMAELRLAAPLQTAVPPQRWFASEADEASFPGAVIDAMAPHVERLGIPMVSVREVHSTPSQERWVRRADLLQIAATVSRASLAMRDASFRRAAAYPEYDAYVSNLTDPNSWLGPAIPQRFGRWAPTTIPSAEDARLCEAILPVRIEAPGLRGPTGFKIVLGFAGCSPDALAEHTVRFERLTHLLSGLFTRLYVALGRNTGVVRTFGDDVARTFFSALLSPTDGAIRPNHVVLAWLHSACETVAWRSGEAVPLSDLSAIVSEVRECLGRRPPTYAAIWRVGPEVSLAAPPVELVSSGLDDEAHTETEATFRWGRIIRRFQELLRHLDLGSTGVDVVVWNPKTRRVRNCSSGEDLPFLLQLPRVISVPLAILLEYDALSLRVSVYPAGAARGCDPLRIRPQDLRRVDRRITAARGRGPVAAARREALWRVTFTFERSASGARPLDLIPWDLETLGRLLRGVSSGSGSSTVDLHSCPVAEELEASPEFRNLAINLAAVVHSGGAYNRDFCRHWNEAPLNEVGARGAGASYAWFTESVVPSLRSHDPGSVREALTAVAAMLRPEGFEARGLDPVILKEGTIRLGGLRRYMTQCLLLFRRIRERGSGSERLFVVTMYVGSVPAGARGTLNPELMPAPKIGLLDPDGKLVKSVVSLVDDVIRTVSERRGLVLVKDPLRMGNGIAL